MATLGDILDDIVGIEETNTAARRNLQRHSPTSSPPPEGAAQTTSRRRRDSQASPLPAANTVADSINNENTGNKAKIDLICDLFESSSGTFDAMLYLQAVQYLEKHEVEHKVASRLLRDADVTDDEWQALTTFEKVTLIFEEPLRTSVGKFLLGLQGVLVFVTIIGIICESLPWWNSEVDPTQADSWMVLDGIISTYFLIELVVRMICFPPPKRRFVFSAVTILDFLSVLPFFIEVILADDNTRNDYGMFKALRLIRLTKLVRHIPTFQNLWMALRKSAPALVAPSIFLLIAMLLFSAGVYYAERGSYDRKNRMFTNTDTLCRASSAAELDKVECNKEESKFFSILHTAWFVITSMTSVGYGDMFPRKPMGMILSCLSMLVGSLFLAMPIAIIGSYYTIIVDENKRVHSNLATRLASSSESFVNNASMTSDDRTDDDSAVEGSGRRRRRRSTMLYESAFDMRTLTEEDQQDLITRRAKERETLSPAEKLISFLRVNVKSAFVKQVDLNEPNPALAFFTNLFLMDFVQEFAKMPVDGISFRQTVGELRPTWLRGAGVPHRLLKVKGGKYSVKLYHEHHFKGRPPEEMAVLLEKEATGRITATERLQLSMAKDQGTTQRRITLMTSNVLGSVAVKIGGGDPHVKQASGLDIHANPQHAVWQGSGGGNNNGGGSNTGIHSNDMSSFVSFADALSAKIESRDGDHFLLKAARVKHYNEQTHLSVTRGRRYYVDILKGASLNFSAERQIYPANIIEFPLHGLSPSSTAASMDHPSTYERINPASVVDDGEGGETAYDEYGNIIAGYGADQQPKVLQYLYEDNVEDIRRAVLAFKCALVIQRREAATLSAAAVSRISGLHDDGASGYNPSHATLLKEEIELLEMCELKSALVRKQQEQLESQGRKQFNVIPGAEDAEAPAGGGYYDYEGEEYDSDEEAVGGYFGPREDAVQQQHQQGGSTNQQQRRSGVLSRRTNLFGSQQYRPTASRKRYTPNIAL